MRKTVLITGGTGGIGQACLNEFVRDSNVIVLDINQEALDLCLQKYPVEGYKIDLLKRESVKQVIEKIIIKHKKIDVLVQTAGIMEALPALEISIDDWQRMMRVNVEGMFFMMQEVIKQSMLENGGCILNFSSQAAIRGYDGPMAAVHYSASKGAVISMSRQMAVEFGKYNIRVNSIAPGGVMTPAMATLDFDEDMSKIPLKCLSTPEDIAKIVAFLCSDAAKMITAQNIIVDGGCSGVGC